MEPIEEQLASLAEHLRRRFERSLSAVDFGPKAWVLPKPRICVMEPKRSVRIAGWHSPKRWQQGFVSLNEIVVTPWAVDKGVYYAAEVLAHEYVHLANAVAGRSDTSRQGRYHNTFYRDTAKALGLTVKSDATHGWCNTSMGKELMGFVRRLVQKGTVDAHVFRYQRLTAPKARPSLVRLIAKCGTAAYVPRGKVDEVVLCCGQCGAILNPET